MRHYSSHLKSLLSVLLYWWNLSKILVLPLLTKYPAVAQKRRLTDLDAKLKFFSTTLKIPVRTEFKVESAYYNLKNSLMDGS